MWNILLFMQYQSPNVLYLQLVLAVLDNFTVRGEPHIGFHWQCVIMTQTRWPPTPCHIRPSQNIHKIDSFLKHVLNICIIGNLFVGRGEWVIKEGASILHQIDRFSGGVNINGSRVHQSKSWYYLGPFRTSKVGTFCGNCFRLYAFNFFVKGSNLDVWLVS